MTDTRNYLNTLADRTFVVAGGTGNVGSYIVRSLLEHGANVAVPSRTELKLADLRRHLAPHVGEDQIHRLHPVVGDLSHEKGAAEIRSRINDELGSIHGALASLGTWGSVSSLLEARRSDFDPVLEGYLFAHLMAARTFLPALTESGGIYVSINGPLAFDIWPDSNSELVSIVTAAQHMLFRALANEFEGTEVQVTELVNHAFIRSRETQPASRVTGEAVGAYASYLLSGADKTLHGKSIHLDSMSRLEQAGIAVGAGG